MHCEIHKARNIAHKIMKEVPQHYADACEKDDYEPVDIDMEYYMQASDLNQCFIVTLNEGDKMVGYSIFTVSSDPIRKGIKEALNTCLYVKKGFRGFGTKKILEDSKDFMESLGADKITYMIKNKALARFLDKCGYEPQEIAWSKAL